MLRDLIITYVAMILVVVIVIGHDIYMNRKYPLRYIAWRRLRGNDYVKPISSG